MIPRVSVAVNAGCFALLAWVYGGDLYDVVRARSSEVAAMSSLPSVPFAAVVLALALAGAGLTLAGVVKKRDGAFRGYRVMRIITVVGLFVDLFVLSADKAPFPSAARVAAAMETFEGKANGLSSASAVTTDIAALQAIADELGAPPLLSKGQPVAKWLVQVKTGCAGPTLALDGAGPGTLFYCVANDRSQAWITAVGLPQEERFGLPQLVSAGGQPFVALVQRRTPEPEESPQARPEEAPNLPVEAPMYFEADAGNLPPLP